MSWVSLEIQRGSSVSRIRSEIKMSPSVCLGLNQIQRWVPPCVQGQIRDIEEFICVSRVRSEMEMGSSACLGLDQRYGGVSLCVQDQIRGRGGSLCVSGVRSEIWRGFCVCKRGWISVSGRRCITKGQKSKSTEPTSRTLPAVKKGRRHLRTNYNLKLFLYHFDTQVDVNKSSNRK